MRFDDRRQAGRALATPLVERQRRGELRNPLVLALPRGGVPVGEEVARALKAPLDVLVARKIGAPFNPEVGVGAIAGEAPPYYDRRALAMLDLTPDQLAPIVARERTELHRREDLYRHGRPPLDLGGRDVILVDDGLATGGTARSALRWARERGAERLILAIPVASPDTAAAMEAEADEVVCLEQPLSFHAVGQWYEDFDQVSDQEVIAILRRFEPVV